MNLNKIKTAIKKDHSSDRWQKIVAKKQNHPKIRHYAKWCERSRQLLHLEYFCKIDEKKIRLYDSSGSIPLYCGPASSLKGANFDSTFVLEEKRVSPAFYDGTIFLDIHHDYNWED